MFDIEGNKNYKVVRILGGVSKRENPYTFLTLEAQPQNNAKFGEKLKVNIWGVDLSKTLNLNDWVKILGAKSVGLVSRKGRDNEKWYEDLTIVCSENDIVLGEAPEEIDTPATLQPIDDADVLPF